MELTAVGVVRSEVRTTPEMPVDGVPARVEIFPPFERALAAIASNSHLVVLTWFDRAPRDLLVAHGRGLGGPLRGVFGLRTPGRPNPIGLHVARLLRVDTRTLHLDRLDAINGTPVIDVKRYSPGWDAVFCARTLHELRPPRADLVAEWIPDLVVAAANFHGERCPGLALGVRMVDVALARWQTGPRDEQVLVGLGDDGCVADALQGVTGASFGNRRLHWLGGPAFSLSRGPERFLFTPRPAQPASVEAVLQATAEELFSVEMDNGRRTNDGGRTTNDG